MKGRGSSAFGEKAFQFLIYALGLAVLGLLLSMLHAVSKASMPAVRSLGLSFLISSGWDPVRERFGMVPFLYGTIVSSILALVIAVPLSIGVAVFIADIAPPWVRSPASLLVELLAAIPSVIYGLWGIFVLAPWLRDTVEPILGRTLGFLPLFQGPPLGIGMLAGGLILAIMITPIITAVTREVIRTVPRIQREGILALGATRWEAIRMVVLPYGRVAITGGVLLGLGRALGETMAVTMVIGNRPEVSASLFAPSYTMAAVIANEFAEATSDIHRAALVEIGLILLLLTVVVNLLARLLIWGANRRMGGIKG